MKSDILDYFTSILAQTQYLNLFSPAT